MQNSRITVLLILILFSSICFAELAWQFDTTDSVIAKPVVSGNTIYVVSQDGNLYSLSASTGKANWKKQLGSYILEPVTMGDGVVAANTNGTVTKMKKDGSVEWKIAAGTAKPQIKEIFGIAVAGQDKIYISTNSGVFSVENNNLTILFNASTANAYGPPVTFGSRVAFTAGEEIIVANQNKQVVWRKKLANVWLSKPVIENSILYIGTTEGRVYALNAENGDLKWNFQAEGWVASTVYIKDGTVYFGTDDGYFYALDAFNGNLKWKTKTRLAVQTTAVGTLFAGMETVAVGGNDGNLYVIKDGEVIWKYFTGDWVTSPSAYKENIIVGSKNGLIYSIKTQRGCTINYPEENSVVSQKEVKLVGNAASSGQIAEVGVMVNEGEWKKATLEGNEWKIKINPNEMKTGPNRVYCKITDSNGEEQEPYYGIGLIKVQETKKSKLFVTAPKTVKINENFTIFVNDGDDNSPVEDFKIAYNGKETIATGNVTLSVTAGGPLKIQITKLGFGDAALDIDVKAPNPLVDLGLPVIGGLVVLAVLYFFVAKRFLKK